MERLQRIEGVSVAAPDGAFYVLPQLGAFFGDGVCADGFGPILDADTLCRCCPCPLSSATPNWCSCMHICLQECFLMLEDQMLDFDWETLALKVCQQHRTPCRIA